LKSVAECLDEVSEYVARNGVGSVTKKDFTLFTQMADNADKGVRENSLKVFAECYAHLGEKIWTLLGEVPMKVKGLLEQRFKTVGKNVSLDRSIGGMN
jgi:ABC-type arginine transport system ATPase subunit